MCSFWVYCGELLSPMWYRILLLILFISPLRATYFLPLTWLWMQLLDAKMAQLNEGEGDGWNDKVRHLYFKLFRSFHICIWHNILEYESVVWVHSIGWRNNTSYCTVYSLRLQYPYCYYSRCHTHTSSPSRYSLAHLIKSSAGAIKHCNSSYYSWLFV